MHLVNLPAATTTNKTSKVSEKTENKENTAVIEDKDARRRRR